MTVRFIIEQQRTRRYSMTVSNEGGEGKKSETAEVIGHIMTGVKVAAIAGLSIVSVASKALSSGASSVKTAADKARDDLYK